MSSACPGAFQRVLAAAPSGLRQRLLVEFIVERLRAVLSSDELDEIHPRSRFMDLGVDSKKALEFKELLEQELERELSTTLMFDYPTPEALARFILGMRSSESGSR